ncbi:MAG: hypothetical protein DMG02_33615 [Acidobacteria bacterium]|nr:MAG: hypothetical protein DMG02_33615 [Acidobacteriota bacterium]
MPGLGGVLGERQFERAAQLRRELLALTWLFATAVGATILLCNRSFIALWVGPQLYAGWWVNLLIVLVTVQTALVRSDAFVLDAALQPRARVIVSAVAALLVLGVGIALAPSLGMAGVCLGLVAGRAVQSIAYPALVHASLGRALDLPWRSLMRPVVASVLVLGSATALGERLLVPGWIAWIGLVVVSFALLLLATLGMGLGDSDRRDVIARMRQIWQGVRGG